MHQNNTLNQNFENKCLKDEGTDITPGKEFFRFIQKEVGQNLKYLTDSLFLNSISERESPIAAF